MLLLVRCFSRSVGEENHDLLVEKERESVAAASLVTALGHTDAAYIQEHLSDPSQLKPATVMAHIHMARCVAKQGKEHSQSLRQVADSGTDLQSAPPAMAHVRARPISAAACKQGLYCL